MLAAERGVQAGERRLATNYYDARGRLVAQADAYGNKKTITYDDEDRLVSQSNALGHSTATDYSTGGTSSATRPPTFRTRPSGSSAPSSRT